MGWTASGQEGYAGVMKPEDLRRYQDEFRAMREMLGTFYLELGISKRPLPDSPDEPAHDPLHSEDRVDDGGPDDPIGPAQDQDC